MKLKLLIPLFFLFISTVHAQETTTSILDDAYQQAKLEDKNVLKITSKLTEDELVLIEEVFLNNK